MSTAASQTRAPSASTAPSGLVAAIRRRPALSALGAIIVAWVVLWSFTRGHMTKVIGGADTTSVHDWLAARANDVVLANENNPFIVVTRGVATALGWTIEQLQFLISLPAFTRTAPHIGYLGVIAIVAWVVYAIAGRAMAVLSAACLVAFGVLGYWQDSMDLLIVTLVAVAICVAIGVPLGIWMAHSKSVNAIVTPVLDVMQTLPSFTYLLPLTLLFGIGAPAAVVCTLVYALPPVIRLTGLGIRSVSETTLEATSSLGTTTWQRLVGVEMPMAKRTVVLGINQTTMAALSMATIAAFINGPGLGQPVVQALNKLKVGEAFVAGMCIVLMAIMLDRVTTAASVYGEHRARHGGPEAEGKRRNILLAGAVVVAVAVYLSRNYTWAATFSDSNQIGSSIADKVQTVVDWISTHWHVATADISDRFTVWLLNPLQDLIANSPWWLTAAAVLLGALAVGGRRALIAAAVCLAGIYYLGLWNNAMITLTSTVIATVFVMLLAAVVGVWMGRSASVDHVIRPILDAGQTMPPFVYLIPVLGLFGPTRFTAIVAGVIYAAPAAIKIVADGIKGVDVNTIEAAESAGTSRWQMITKVQIPMARSSFVVAANQGLLYVLSMVVIGGLVGAGALGYDVVTGFKQLDFIGRGLAAGFSIVLLGVLLDRITRYAAERGRVQTA
jgi:glycine betaine/proline transport system permease protein